MRLTLRRSLATAAAATLLVTLTACGGDDDAGNASDETTSSASSDAGSADGDTEESDGAEDAASDEAEDEGEDEGGDAAEGEEISAEDFLADFQEGLKNTTTAHMTMSTSAGGINLDVEGDVDYSTTPPRMSVTMNAPAMGGKIDMRMLDGKMYMNMGQMSQNKFYAIDLNDPNSPMGDMSDLTGSMDPVQSFEQFADGLESVVYQGEEDGLDRYTLTIDTSKVESLEGAGAEGLPRELEYDIWLDDEKRMNRAQVTMGAMGSVDIEMSKFGEDVDIKAPPANQIAKMPGASSS